MRIIGIFERQDQVGGLVDSLRKVGLDRKDMIISDVIKTKDRHSALDDVYIKTESDSLTSLATLSDHFIDKIDETVGGIIVAVETSKANTSRIREMMEQNGATKIFQD